MSQVVRFRVDDTPIYSDDSRMRRLLRSLRSPRPAPAEIQFVASADGTPVIRDPNGRLHQIINRPEAVVLDAPPYFDGDIPDTIRLTGSFLPGGSLVMARGVDVDGKAAWVGSSAGGDNWFAEYDDGSWLIYDGGGTYSASKVSVADTPVGLTSWTVTLGAGQPTITAVGAPGVPGRIAIVGEADIYVCVASPGIWAGPLAITP